MVVLSDLIQRTQFAIEILRQSLLLSVFWNAGVVVPDAELKRMMLANVGKMFDFDYFNDLTATDNIGDDSNNDANVDGIDTGTDTAIANFRNIAFGAKSITANLSSTGNAMTAISGRIGARWALLQDAVTIAIVTGIIESNILNDGGDMVISQTGTLVDIGMILDTIQTAGDAQDNLFGAMICHSAIRTALRKQGVTDKVYDLQGNYLYEALSGLRLVVRDNVETGVPSAGDYTSYVIGTGLVGYGEGAPAKALELDSRPLSGNGAGEEILVSRRNYCLHPYGFSFVGSPASTTPTNAEFADAASWERTADRKAVKLAALRCSAQ